MRFPVLHLALAILAAATPISAQTRAKAIIPEGWVPALAPAIQEALEQLKAANSQPEMNSLSRQVADMTDAQLFIAYVRLYEKLAPKEREALVAEQAKWLKARAKTAEVSVESKGGSLAPMEANNTELTLTEKRLADLRTRLKALGGETTTAARATAVDGEGASKEKTTSSADDEPTAKPKKKKKPAADEG